MVIWRYVTRRLYLDLGLQELSQAPDSGRNVVLGRRGILDLRIPEQDDDQKPSADI